MYISNFSVDEFGRISNEPYVKECLETNLLNTFCSDTESKARVTISIVNSLTSCKSQTFSTKFHVDWAMEFLGYAFSLPIEHEEVISSAFSIYKKWLLTDDRPACIAEDESSYQQVIIGHLSLLFTERGGNSLNHAKLCSEALLLLKQITDQSKLTEETWKFILKILLLISNTILCNMGALSQSISPLLLTILFEIWIRSNIRDQRLWRELEQNSSLWLDHIWFISQWGSVIIELTNKVVSLLYGEYKTSTTITFSGLEESQNLKINGSLTFKLEMPAETAIYYWHNFLKVMMNNTISKIPFDYKVHKELANTMAKIIDVFLEVCDARNQECYGRKITSESSEGLDSFINKLDMANEAYSSGTAKLPIPSANSLLTIFGDWLFFHAVAHDSFSEFGNAVAVGAFCKIICKAQGPVHQTYLNKFYKTLIEYFHKDLNPLIIGFIISNSQNLFSLDHRGARILAYDEKFLCSIKNLLSDPATTVMKKPCCMILSTVVGLNSVLGNENSTKIIMKIFLSLLKSRCEVEVFNRIIWSLSVLAVTENDVNTSEIIDGLVSQLQEIDYISQRNNYNALLSCISTFPYIVKHVSNAEFILDKLCSYIARIQAKNTSESLVLHISAILNWVICFPNCFFSNSLQQKIIEAISADFPNKTVKENAEFVLGYLRNSLNSNFEYNTLRINSAIINSSNIFHLVKHFLYKSEFILSIYNVKIDQVLNKSILCILRNSLGKFVWLTEVNYSPIKENVLLLEIPNFTVSKRIEEDLDEHIDLPDDDRYDNFSMLFESQSRSLARAQENKTEDYSASTQISSTCIDESVSYRIILSQLGLFHDEQLRDIMAIENDSVSMITDLDNILVKDMLIFPILYLQSSESNISGSNGYFSEAFMKFLGNLGSVLSEEHKNIEIFSHINYLISKYKQIIYNADSLNEIVFVSPVLSKDIEISEIISLSSTIIIWNERVNDSYSLKLPNILKDKNISKNNIIQLVSAWKNKVMIKRGANDMQGPLIDEMVVTLDILPKLLVRTLLNIHPMFSLRVRSQLKRATLLRKINETVLVNNELARIQKILTHSFFP